MRTAKTFLQIRFGGLALDLIKRSEFAHPSNDVLRARSNGAQDFRFGSEADILRCGSPVHFTPESGHLQRTGACPLSANSGHRGRDHFCLC